MTKDMSPNGIFPSQWSSRILLVTLGQSPQGMTANYTAIVQDQLLYPWSIL